MPFAYEAMACVLSRRCFMARKALLLKLTGRPPHQRRTDDSRCVNMLPESACRRCDAGRCARPMSAATASAPLSRKGCHGRGWPAEAAAAAAAAAAPTVAAAGAGAGAGAGVDTDASADAADAGADASWLMLRTGVDNAASAVAAADTGGCRSTAGGASGALAP